MYIVRFEPGQDPQTSFFVFVLETEEVQKLLADILDHITCSYLCYQLLVSLTTLIEIDMQDTHIIKGESITHNDITAKLKKSTAISNKVILVHFIISTADSSYSFVTGEDKKFVDFPISNDAPVHEVFGIPFQ